jgi:DNA replication and repair protein RecF
MHVRLLEARSFRNLGHARVGLGDGVTLIHGPNGAGKSNLLEALCFGLTASSWRTRADRELIGFGEELARAEVTVADGGESRSFIASASRSEGRSQRLNGNPVPDDAAALRPAVAVFSPDRLALIKGPPTERRGHVDRFVAALWPARADARRRFGRALAQRNALLGRIRAGVASEDALGAWDAEFAAEAAALIEARTGAVERLAPSFAALAGELGLSGAATLRYRPRMEGDDVAAIAAELSDRRRRDAERGHSTHGPHLDEIEIALEGRALRRYGSQGQQRVALLALIFAERAALLDARRTPPLMLLDDVMSELDPERRELLVELLRHEGQALITATEPSQVPAAAERAELEIQGGRVLVPAPAARAA